MRIFVGNIDERTSDYTLRELFERHGLVNEVRIVTDRDSGRRRGFAFVVMPDPAEGHGAIRSLDGVTVDGRRLKVNESRPRPR